MREARFENALAVAATASALLFATGCSRAASEEPPAPTAVTVAPVGRADVADTLTVRGRLVPPVEEDATLAPQVAGRIVELAVREGEAVAHGALLATIERHPLEEAVATAEAALARAKEDEAVRGRASTLTDRLFEKGISSAEERDADRAALQAARAARVEAEGRLTQARRTLSWGELRAPFDGVVAKVLRHPGEVVDGTPATPVVRLLGTSAQEVSADLTADVLSRVAPGSVAHVVLPGATAPVEGRVLRVARSVDTATGVGEIRVRLQGRSSSPLLSAVTVALELAVRRGVVAVPLPALRRSQEGGEEVVVVVKGAAHVVPVTTGLRSPDLAEVPSGLAGGEQVVVDTPLGLAEGQPLAVRGGGTER